MAALVVDNRIEDTVADVSADIAHRPVQFQGRTLGLGAREWVSLAATGVIGLWVCAIVLISVAGH